MRSSVSLLRLAACMRANCQYIHRQNTILGIRQSNYNYNFLSTLKAAIMHSVGLGRFWSIVFAGAH